jgi:Leucine-rich repeat (LRR) protein
MHAWPSSLRSLRLGAAGAVSLGLQRLINALPSSAPAIQSLTLMQNDAHIDLAPLLQLPQLTRLVTQYLEPFQLAVVKQLSGLTDVSIANGGWSAEELRALLCNGTHHLQRLQRINLREVTLDVGTVHSLQTLTGLTELAPRSVDPSCFPLLRSLCTLRKLCIACNFGTFDQAAAVALLASLRALSNLTSFELKGRHSGPIAQQMLLVGLVIAVPRLRELSLTSCTLRSLVPITLCTELRILSLMGCKFSFVDPCPVVDVLPLLQSFVHLEHFSAKIVSGCCWSMLIA